jgi:hypothetical protein
MQLAHAYTQLVEHPAYDIQISPGTLYGHFEHKDLGENAGGGLLFERWNDKTVLMDADGCSNVPTPVLDALVRAGYTVPKEHFLHEPDHVPDTDSLMDTFDAAGPWYMIAKRSTCIGGGFTLHFREHGQPAGGGVFPAHDNDHDSIAFALADAIATGDSWRSSEALRAAKP